MRTLFDRMNHWFLSACDYAMRENSSDIDSVVTTETDICFGKELSSEFIVAILDMCTRLKWNVEHVNYLIACMAFETGGTFKPDCRNLAGSGATGLIQFMPRTAKGLGTTVARLAAMSQIEQLKYVEAYFKPYASKINTLPDMYMAILMPKYIKSSPDAVLFKEGTVGYRQNAGLDLNKDGVVTKKEATSRVLDYYRRGMASHNKCTIKIN